jgi:hypothetical protein
MARLLEEIGKTLFRIIFGCLMIWTGEIVLYLVTIGRHKPRWDMYLGDSPVRYVIFSEICFWLGFSFWIGTILLLRKFLSVG